MNNVQFKTLCKIISLFSDLFIYSFLGGAVLGLHCCVGFSLVVASVCHSVDVVCGPLTEGAFLIVGHRL